MDRLTPRQGTVLDACCRLGETIKATARRLGIDEQTVKNHRTAIMRTMEAVSMCQVCWLYGLSDGSPITAMRARDV